MTLSIITARAQDSLGPGLLPSSPFGAQVLTGHRDVDVLSPLTSQVGRMAGVDTSIALSSAGKHQLVALLVDPAVGGQPGSCMLPPHTGLRQTLGGGQATRSSLPAVNTRGSNGGMSSISVGTGTDSRLTMGSRTPDVLRSPLPRSQHEPSPGPLAPPLPTPGIFFLPLPSKLL